MSIVYRIAQLRSAGRRLEIGEFARHSLIVFAAGMLVNIVNYAFHLFISRRLGVTSYGTLSSLIAALALSAIPATIVTIVVVKIAAEFASVGNRRALSSLFSILSLYGSFVACLLGAAGILLSRQIAVYLQISDHTTIYIACAVIALNIILPVIRALLQGVQAFGDYAISISCEGIGKFAVGVLLVYLGFGVRGAVAGFAFGGLISLIYTFRATYRHIGFIGSRGDVAWDARRIFHTSGGAAISTIATTVLGFADVVLVKHYFSPTLAGYYGAISLVGKMLYFMVGFVPTIVLPKTVNSARNDNRPERIVILALGVSSMISLCGLGIFALFPSLTLNTLVGNAFEPAVPYLLPYGLAMSILAITNIAASYKIGIHRFNYLLPLSLATVAEIIAIILFHASLFEVIEIIIIANACALCGTLWGIGERVRTT